MIWRRVDASVPSTWRFRDRLADSGEERHSQNHPDYFCNANPGNSQLPCLQALSPTNADEVNQDLLVREKNCRNNSHSISLQKLTSH